MFRNFGRDIKVIGGIILVLGVAFGLMIRWIF